MQNSGLPDLRQRVPPYNPKDDPNTGLFQPFRKSTLGTVRRFVDELRSVLKEHKAKRILLLLALNTLCSAVLFCWSCSTGSLALGAPLQLTLFDVLCLASCLLGLWVSQNKASPSYSFGYRRWEVLAIFATTILSQLGSLLIVKESLERLVQQPEVHTGRLVPATLLSLFCHLAVQHSVEQPALMRVLAASSSSWLQEHVAELSQSLCQLVPGLSGVLLPRLNPILLLGWAQSVLLLLTHCLLRSYNWHQADTFAAILLAAMGCATMLPMSIHCAGVLLQTTPSHLLGQLDKCLREASTLDGVLEFRHEHFWTLSLGSLAGSVHVRVRRDANEQLVLAHIVDRLSNLVPELTVQVFKDEWAWSRVKSFHEASGRAATLDLQGGQLAPPVAQFSDSAKVATV